MQHVYGIFGYEFDLELSTRPENYMGELALWDKAEAVRIPFSPCPMMHERYSMRSSATAIEGCAG